MPKHTDQFAATRLSYNQSQVVRNLVRECFRLFNDTARDLGGAANLPPRTVALGADYTIQSVALLHGSSRSCRGSHLARAVLERCASNCDYRAVVGCHRGGNATG